MFHRIADATDQDVETIEREFRRKRGYVEYLLQEDVTDVDRLFGFLSDLRTDEAATVERVRRQRAHQTAGPDTESSPSERETGTADDASVRTRDRPGGRKP